MILFMILGVIVLIALGVLGVLFYMLSKEGDEKAQEKVVALKDLEQIRKELSSSLLDQPQPQLSKEQLDVVPPFEPKVSMPVQQVVSPFEDESYKKHAQELENELRDIANQADHQSDEAKEMIETLTKENEDLKLQKANLELAQEKLGTLQQEASGLKVENLNLQTQLDSSNAKLKQLEAEMTAVKLQMGEEISRANATVVQLNQEKTNLISSIKPEPQDGYRKELETLQAEHASLRQKMDELEKTISSLRDENSLLKEKNGLLQYEMIKARAQSSGLERVSFNYKNQLEDFFKKINSMQVSNDHLSQAKNRLENVVEQIKGQNEELLKKDQLSQFELDKNRSRLLNLEREYEDLKARVLQGGQQ